MSEANIIERSEDDKLLNTCIALCCSNRTVVETCFQSLLQPNLEPIHMNTLKLPNLDKELHLRISKEFEVNLARVAANYNMKKSTFCRVLLMRELHNYDRSRLFT